MDKTIIIIVSILVLAGLGVGIYFLMKSDKCDPDKCGDNEECTEGQKECICKEDFAKNADNVCTKKHQYNI